MAYQPWGEPWTAPATAAGDRQYNGRIFDSGTGFHDYGARMYWPEIGRFISVDSAEPNPSEPTTFNRYAYVLNNPYKYVDPNGRVPFLAVTGLIGLVGGMVYGAISSAYSDEGFNFNAVYKWGAIGGVAGLTLGAGTSLAVTAGATIEASVAEVGYGAMALLGIGGEGGRRATTEEAEQFFIENGVRRSLAVREAGLDEIPATIYRPGEAPVTTTLRLDQLFSPKATVPMDSRFLSIEPPIQTPIEVQPLGLPGQALTVPLEEVTIEP